MRNKILYKGKLVTLEQLIEMLKKEFRKHIGEENGISLSDLLEKLFPESEEERWSIWKRYTYIDILRKLIGIIRRKKGVFIMYKKGMYFVMKNQDEADYYKDTLKRDIVGMKKSIVKADEWVEEEKWRDI